MKLSNYDLNQKDRK